MSIAVELRKISKSYHSLQSETFAIENISFEVEEGEFISIVGPSGCGKSTLLSIICGLVPATCGEILIMGKDVKDADADIGYMLQKDHLFEWRNIYSNVLLGLEIRHKLTEENKEYAYDLLCKYGLEEFGKHYPSELSGGMRQRAALIRTLALKPDILLLDEPFSALDYQTRLHVADEIGTIIKNEKKTAILVTHDISEAVSVSDRVIVLTQRPSTVKAVHDIEFDMPERTPLKSREAVEFKDYFNSIWKELEAYV